MKVYSQRDPDSIPLNAIYVGRPTKYGNPFHAGVDGTRDEVISRYRTWIMLPQQKNLRADMKRELKGCNLVCWCAPLPCHADIILEIANEA